MYIIPRKLGNDYCIDQIDERALLDWGALDRYPKLHQLDYEGYDKTLITWLAKRRSVKHLIWQMPGLTGDFDFRRTHLEQISIQAAKAQTIRLPRCAKGLFFLQHHGTEKIRVEAPRQGADVDVTIGMGSSTPPRMPEGLSGIASLGVWWAECVKIKPLLGCTALERLHLGGDPTFALPDPQHLAKFRMLRELELDGAYEMEASRFPALPRLETLRIRGTIKETAAVLRERFSKIDLEITGIKSVEWIRANVGNPFRDWDDDHGARIAAVAKKAWKAAKRLDDRASLAAVKKALKPFIAVFNRLDATGDVDTIMREEIYDAFCELVPKRHQDAAEAMFDAMRDF